MSAEPSVVTHSAPGVLHATHTLSKQSRLAHSIGLTHPMPFTLRQTPTPLSNDATHVSVSFKHGASPAHGSPTSRPPPRVAHIPVMISPFTCGTQSSSALHVFSKSHRSGPSRKQRSPRTA